MTKDIVYTAVKNEAVWIRIIGRGTFQNSHPVKKWVLEKISSGYTNIFIDLGECTGMDSTFMGVITGLSIRLKGLGKERATLVNVSAHNMRLLDTLGLNKFLNLKDKYEIDNSLQWELLPIEPLDKLAVTKHMIEAHEKLIDATKEAKDQFKSVHKLLKEDMERQTRNKEK